MGGADALEAPDTEPSSELREPRVASGVRGDGVLTDGDRRRLDFYVCFLRGWPHGRPEAPYTRSF